METAALIFKIFVSLLLIIGTGILVSGISIILVDFFISKKESIARIWPF